MTKSLNKLKPCPFCGGIALLESLNGSIPDDLTDFNDLSPARAFIHCMICGVQTHVYIVSGECCCQACAVKKAIGDWNRRLPPDSSILLNS